MPDATRPRPHLEVVAGGSDAHPQPVPSRSRNWIAWILGALLALALGGVYQQQQTQTRLEGQIEGLTADLAATRTALQAAEITLDAHRQHLGDVRAAVSDLEALVSRDPETTAGR